MHLHFLVFLVGRVLVWTGGTIALVAFPLAMWLATGEARWTAALTAVETAPYLLLGLPAGALADRLPRRSVMGWSGIAAAVPVALLAWQGSPGPVALIVVSVASSSFFVLADAAGFGLLPELVERERIADAVARWAAPDATLIAGGRVKHMALTQNEVLGRYFAAVQPQRAERKSRLIVASGALPVSDQPPFPVSRQHDGFTLCAYGGAFAGARLDVGTRVLIDVMPTLAPPDPPALHVVDLGCGTGALAVAFAQQHPDARITATDRSASAARSAQASVVANGLAGRVTVTLDDAGSELPDGSADLILLNPPFHLGTSVHEGAGHRLIQAAARLLRPGGEVWTVFNSHLDHRGVLTRDVGPTEQVARTPKFTVTRSVRRG